VSLFVGDVEDIADKSYGLFLPNFRKHAKKHYNFLGSILAFNLQDYSNTAEIKGELGYGASPLIICSIGGTDIGVDLLNLCSRTYIALRDKLPELKMVLICGPRIDPESIKVTEAIQVKGYVPDLYKRFAACDLAIVQGGETTTTEIVALNKSYLYFPLEEHFEQKLVSDKLERLGAGVKMSFSETDESILLKAVLENLGKTVDYENIKIEGAVKAAEFIQLLL
jgi:predicted glycosyltransferase